MIEVEIPLVNNMLFEDFETYSVTLIGVSPPTGYIRGGTDGVEIFNSQSTHQGVITDDDSGKFVKTIAYNM